MKIFIGCSSSNNLDQKYYDLAEELANEISKQKHELIYGSGKNGMMGILYNCFKENECRITSIVPKLYKESVKDLDLDEIVNVETTDQQINYLVNAGDISIILPGGFGVIAELLMLIYTRMVNENNKPLIILNAYNFYDNLINMFEKIYKENFSKNLPSDIYIVESTEEVLSLIKKHNN